MEAEDHRRRIELEDKAKVVASVWEAEFGCTVALNKSHDQQMLTSLA